MFYQALGTAPLGLDAETSGTPATVNLTGVAAAGSVGTVTTNITLAVNLTGVSAAGAVGTVTQSTTTVVNLTGVSATGTAGAAYKVPNTQQGILINDVDTGGAALICEIYSQPTGGAGTVYLDGETNGYFRFVPTAGWYGVTTWQYRASADSGSTWSSPETVTITVDPPTVVMVGTSATGAVGSVAVTGAASVTPAGVSATGAVGNQQITTAATITLAGVSAGGSAGSIAAGGGVVVSIPSVSATGAAGQITASSATIVTLSGIAATGAVGTLTITGAATVTLAGVSATGRAGYPTIPGQGSSGSIAATVTLELSVTADVYNEASSGVSNTRLFVISDNVVTVNSVRNTVSGDYINNATVTLSLADAAGSAVSGQSWPLTLDYVASSNGKYQGVIDSAASLLVGKRYKATITINAGGGLVVTRYVDFIAARATG